MARKGVDGCARPSGLRFCHQYPNSPVCAGRCKRKRMSDVPSPLVKVRHLDAWFSQAKAVKDINIEFNAKTVTAIIGPSGCGKSTFIRCLNRLHEEVPGATASGEVLL